VDALGSSESPVGVSEGGKGRFLPANFRVEVVLEVGSAVVWTSSCGMSGELVEKSVPTFVSIVVAVVGAAPVRGNLACLDFFHFFLVVAVSPR